jgi:hypothetical protein
MQSETDAAQRCLDRTGEMNAREREGEREREREISGDGGGPG